MGNKRGIERNRLQRKIKKGFMKKETRNEKDTLVKKRRRDLCRRGEKRRGL